MNIVRNINNVNRFGKRYETFINPRYNFTQSLAPSDVSISSLYWLQIYKASDFPLFTISTDYFAILSTDHSPTVDGAIIWGECDDMYLTNFVEKGTILSEYRGETPQLIKITTAESGLASDEYFLYYHTDYNDPSNSGVQQTHLLTTSGGNQPHLCTWTQQGNVLGLLAEETHTGYLSVIKRGTSDYIGFHTTKTSVGAWKMSTSVDGLNWTRGALINDELNLPETYHCSFGDVFPFTFNSTSYVATVFWIEETPTSGLMICEHDANYRPNGIAQIMFESENTDRSFWVGIEGSWLYIHRKTGVNNADNLHPYQVRGYDLNVLL